GKVLIDGKEYFGDDAAMALRNLPADVVDRIQVFDRMSDQARFTGFDDGNAVKTINIITKSDRKNAQFGKLYAAYGTNDRYMAGGNVNIFKGDRRIALIGMSNNLNIQNFSTQDLLGVTGSSGQGRGGMGGGGAGGGRSGMGGGGGRWMPNNPMNNFLVGQQNGVAQTHAFGTNYTDTWYKKINVSASYFFNFSRVNNWQEMGRNYFLTNQQSQFYVQNTDSRTDNHNHRLNARIEYKIDSMNTLIVTPRLSIQENTAFNNVFATNTLNRIRLNASENRQTRDGWSYNLSNDLLWQHAFVKRGRTFSLNLNTQLNNRYTDTQLLAYNQFFRTTQTDIDTLRQFSDQLTDGYTLGSSIAYTEPLSKNAQLQLDYIVSHAKNHAARKTYDEAESPEAPPLLNRLLSNEFDNFYTTHRTGVSYRLNKDRKMILTTGISYQYAVLKGEQIFPVPAQVYRTFHNVLPNAMLRYNFSENSNLRLFYRASTNAPTVSQLQEVVDNTNPLLLNTGNPSLKQEYSQFLGMRYSLNNAAKATSLFVFANINHIRNFIGNTSLIATENLDVGNGIVLNKGAQLIRPENLDGFFSARAFAVYGFPITKLKINVSLNNGVTYTKLPSRINQKQNFSNSYLFSQGITLSSNISEKVDFSLGYTANYNLARNTLQPELNNNFFYHSLSFRSSWTFGKGFLWQNELFQTLYTGLADGFNQNFWLWTTSVGKKILKDQRGEIKLSVFDVLNQNANVSRSVTDTYVEDMRNTVLRQYYLLTFTYYLKAFKA
ncbi:MAG: outer membrane beta-barrel family protein, partial [Flammeovirgaceae bacterium]|nr:outer membrane beta-barrel family protein [Flammeovirgaceae bacterium]MDW8286985.1 outer membrane beta-barrel protein [Flammeovirgaceae bacterium]